ncbi:hypothetical protein Nepgr_014641 [Nepenthes gracilis]|uniref:Uncharacterized protein n=1 Tax=Nepenthes gracilis TaxID=150966 RepID=A0AAD3SJM0_NEPGR|nr:hypothetical protein Nepgr_014641 [Nepenthes gracilis]
MQFSSFVVEQGTAEMYYVARSWSFASLGGRSMISNVAPTKLLQVSFMNVLWPKLCSLYHTPVSCFTGPPCAFGYKRVTAAVGPRFWVAIFVIIGVCY